MPNDRPDIAAAIMADLRLLRWATVGLFLVVVAAVVVGWLVSTSDRAALHREEARTAVAQARTAAALCTFRSDLEGRVAATAGFLRDHPGGIAGIPRSVLQASLANQRATVASLHDLICPAVTTTP